MIHVLALEREGAFVRGVEMTGRKRVGKKGAGADAVQVVRKVMERRMSGEPFFKDELEEVAGQLRVLEERVIRVRSLGGVFGRVEMSPYVREMLGEVVTGQPV